MFLKSKKYLSLLILLSLFSTFFTKLAFSSDDVSLIEATPSVREYAINTVKPVLELCEGRASYQCFLKFQKY